MSNDFYRMLSYFEHFGHIQFDQAGYLAALAVLSDEEQQAAPTAIEQYRAASKERARVLLRYFSDRAIHGDLSEGSELQQIQAEIDEYQRFERSINEASE